MAELCPGDTYSLSSKKSCNDDIEYIFVKLTDSAYRALQEYQRNQSRISATPAIQLQENGGHLSIPSAPQSFRGAGSSPSTGGANSNGQQQQQVTFSFTLSSNADIEGPQGSFECVQRRADRLDSLGALARKMRIHANEDVYEATRHRMAVAEENQKNKCTREIKPDQTDIGRKVKVKQLPQRPLNSVKPLSMIHPLHQQPSLGNGISRHSNSNNHNRQPQGSSPPPASSNPGGGGARPAPLGVLGQQQGLGSNGVSTDANGAVNGAAKNGRISHAGRTNASNAPKSDVMRRPIKERLIHLLALRPYKKPELYSRINQEGIKEREKNCIATVLKQISNMRDNTYHLRRNIWNDVHDDWPFYTMDERALMKRRKPQNLTPPTSSDGGSSGSGQSPSSTHAGSPPQAISGNGGGPGKRQGSSLRDHHSSSAYDTGGGVWDGSVAPKKQRISHFRKPPTSSENNNNGINAGSLYNRPSPPTENGNGYGNKVAAGAVTENGYRRNVTDSRESSNMNPRSREEIIRNNPLSSSFISAGNSGSNNSNSNNNVNNGFHSSQNGVASQNGGGDDENLEPQTANGRGDAGHALSRSNSNNNMKKPMQHYSDTSNNSLSFGVIRDPKTMGLGYDRNAENQYTNGAINGGYQANADRQANKSDDKKRNKVYPKSSSPSIGNGHINTQSTGNSSDSPSTLSERLADNNESSQKSSDCEPPQFDFSSEYTRIQSIEQRRKYKREFDENYDEYRDLHNAVDQVSQRFVALEERLRSVQPDSQEYKDIKRQIVTEYNQHLQDSRHTAKLNRYQYLHHKLSHIKRLVVAYDNEIKCKPV